MQNISVFSVISCLLAFCALQSVNAAAFDCGDLTPGECHIKFAEQYERDFKAIHIAAIDNLFKLLKPIFNDIIAELPQDDAVAEKLKNFLDNVNVYVQNLNDNKDDNSKLIETIKRIMDDAQFDMDDIGVETVDYDSLAKKYKLREVILDRLFECVTEMADLFGEMYKGLREQDLTKYPKYGEINAEMKMLKEAEKNSRLIERYSLMKERLGLQFQMPYLFAVKDLL